MDNNDPYRNIARFFPAFDNLLEIFLPGMRADLVGFLRQNRLARILDLGCGTGGLARVLADEGFSPVGLDASPAMLERARKVAAKAPPFPVVLSDGQTIPLPPGFDASVMRFVLHEMAPPVRESILAELLRVVDPGKYILFIDYIRPADTGTDFGLGGRLGGSILHLIESQMIRVHSPHYENFREFMAQGGTMEWARKRCGTVSLINSYFRGNIGLVAVRAPST